MAGKQAVCSTAPIYSAGRKATDLLARAAYRCGCGLRPRDDQAEMRCAATGPGRRRSGEYPKPVQTFRGVL